nr:DUF3828 domain-containing protein [Sphingomonas sp.]
MAPTETPKAYIERVFASYHSPSFNSLDHPGRYFAPKLVAAIAEDARLAGGEVGYLDGDPVCQCQDPAGLHAIVRQVTQQGRDAAKVRVSIAFTGEKPRTATFTLVRTKGGWRIADVSSSGEPSLLTALQTSNRKRAGKK